MTVEEQLKKIILERYKSIRAFTQMANLPYSTVDTMFKRGISGTGVSTVLKIFNTLDLDVESISSGTLTSCYNTKKSPTQFSGGNYKKEILINNFDSLNQVGKDKLVDYSEDLKANPKYIKTYNIKIAARNGEFEEKTITDSDFKKIMDLPDVNDLK